jgi:hypothetical protein
MIESRTFSDYLAGNDIYAARRWCGIFTDVACALVEHVVRASRSRTGSAQMQLQTPMVCSEVPN